MPIFGNIDCSTKEETTSNYTHKARHEERILHARVVYDSVIVAIMQNDAVSNLSSIKAEAFIININ